MVSVRKTGRSLPRSPSVHKQQHVESNHPDKEVDFRTEAEEKRTNYSEEQGCDHEGLGNLNLLAECSEVRMTSSEALSVSAKKTVAVQPPDAMASPINHVKPKLAPAVYTNSMPMLSAVLHLPAPHLVFPRGLFLPPAQVMDRAAAGAAVGLLELRQAKRGPYDCETGPSPKFVVPQLEGPVVELQQCGVGEECDDVDENENGFALDLDSTLVLQGDKEVLKSKEVSGGCMKVVEESPLITSRGLDFGNTGMNDTIRPVMTRDERAEYTFGSAAASESHQGAEQVSNRGRRFAAEIIAEDRFSAEIGNKKRKIEVQKASLLYASPLKKSSHYNLRSSCTNSGELNKHHGQTMERERSLLDALYLLVLTSGPKGILLEDLIIHLQYQSPAALFASDQEATIEKHLKQNSCFVQDQGYYFLSKDLDNHSSKTISAKQKEKVSPHYTTASNQYCGGKSNLKIVKKPSKMKTLEEIETSASQ